MRKLLFLLLALGLWTCALAAQQALESITVATEPGSMGNSAVALCCTPLERWQRRQDCSYVWRRAAQGATSYNLSIKILCNDLRENAQVVWNPSWVVALNSEQDRPLYQIDCQSNRAWWLGAAPAATPPATVQVSKSQEAPAPSSPPSNPPSGDAKAKPSAVAKLNDRLDEVEKALKEQRRSVQSLQEELGNLRGATGREVEKQLKEILDRLRALEDAQKNSCLRIDDGYKGQEEVLIAVAGGVLRFVKVKPRSSTVAIGLSEAKANELLAAAQAESKHEIFPHILLSVPEAVREVKPFFLQDRLIDPQLYSRLTSGKSANRVAYQDVQRFIAELNSRCNGRAQFVLPSEEQFVAAAQELYDPVANGLKPCEALRDQDRRFEITELFSHAWQLTRSLCVPFSDPPRTACPDGASYIRKGGAASSTDRLECMPEYRGLAPFDVNQQETSFRLALAE